MQLRFVDVDLFAAAAERRVPVTEQNFIVRDPATGSKIKIIPGISVHRDLTILGTDFLPMRADGLSALAQMMHTPQLFPGKARNLVQEGDGWVAAPARRRTLDERAVLVGSGSNYYHWWIDHMPRLLMARMYDEIKDRKIIVEPQPARFVLDTLKRFGIGEDQLLRIEPDEALTLSEVVVPNMLASVTVCHPLVPALAREALGLPKPKPKGRRLYVSRQDAPTRKLANEDALIALLERHGFEVLVPARMSQQAQIDACADAAVLLAVHGAALTNMIFAPPGAQVVEIFTPSYRASFFKLLSHVSGHRHHFVPAPMVDPDPDKSPLHHERWEVDLAAMEQTLEAL